MSGEYSCPECGASSEHPGMENVTGGIKLSCPECGATDFQPDAGFRMEAAND